MSITFTWKISSRAPLVDPDTDAVLVAYYDLTAQQNGHTEKRLEQAVSFEPKPDSPDFVPFAELTEDTVLGWIKDRLGPGVCKAREDALAEIIQQQINPSEVLKPFPFQEIQEQIQ